MVVFPGCMVPRERFDVTKLNLIQKPLLESDIQGTLEIKQDEYGVWHMPVRSLPDFTLASIIQSQQDLFPDDLVDDSVVETLSDDVSKSWHGLGGCQHEVESADIEMSVVPSVVADGHGGFTHPYNTRLASMREQHRLSDLRSDLAAVVAKVRVEHGEDNPTLNKAVEDWERWESVCEAEVFQWQDPNAKPQVMVPIELHNMELGISILNMLIIFDTKRTPEG